MAFNSPGKTRAQTPHGANEDWEWRQMDLAPVREPEQRQKIRLDGGESKRV